MSQLYSKVRAIFPRSETVEFPCVGGGIDGRLGFGVEHGRNGNVRARPQREFAGAVAGGVVFSRLGFSARVPSVVGL